MMAVQRNFCEAYNMSIEIMRKYQKIEQIRAEIEQEYNRFRNMSDKWSERACGLGTALEIIDKALKNLNESMEQFENGEVSDGTNI